MIFIDWFEVVWELSLYTKIERSVSIELSAVEASIILIAIVNLHLVEQVLAEGPSTRHA